MDDGHIVDSTADIQAATSSLKSLTFTTKIF